MKIAIGCFNRFNIKIIFITLLLVGAKTLAGSLTGGTKDTQSMLEYCAAHKVYPKIELIKIDYINEALERMIKRDVKYRFVIDIENSFE